MPTPADRAHYNAARDKIDKLIRDHSEDIQEQLKILARIRTQRTLEWITIWRKKNIQKINGFDSFVDYAALEGSVSLAFTDYFRYVFYYRMSNQMHENILFRKVLSFEFHYFAKHAVLARVNHIEARPTRNADAELFYLWPLAHFFNYRIHSEFYNRRKDAIHQSLADNITALVQLAQVCIANMTQFALNMAGDNPGLFAFKEYIESGSIRLESVIRTIEATPDSVD